MRPEYTYKAAVLSVYDGDTITVAADLGMHVTIRAKLRLYRIDAPEMGTPLGLKARDHLRSLLVPPLTIKTFKDPGDKYGRWLADVYSGDICVNDQMVIDGMAIYYGGGTKPD